MPAETAGDISYENAATPYSTVRRPDPHIAAQIHAALGRAVTVVNVGAGTGSYEPEDRYVVAVEPSAAMRARRSSARPAIDASAEVLPFDDGSFDAAVATLTVHHWPELAAGLGELRRVARGPVVILTADPDALDSFWLADYCPEVIAVERRRYPPIATISRLLTGDVVVMPVEIPVDCTDGFTEAFYARPEQFLDPTVRAAQSAWSFVSPDAEQRFVEQLESDLADGTWQTRYGRIAAQPTFVGSMRLIVGTRSGPSVRARDGDG